MKRMYGINPAVITPFDRHGKIDWDALKEHVDFLIEKGAHNLYPLGTTAEMLSMELSERKAVAEKVLAFADGRVDVFVHIGALIPHEAQELARHALAIGAAGVGAVSPYYYNISQQEIYSYFEELSGSIPEDYPLYLYNLPCCAVNDILPDTVLQLSKLSNIVGIKNTMGDIARLTELLRKLPTDFDVIMGEDAVLMPSLALGAKGSVSGMSNMFPELFVGMYQDMENGKLTAAAKAQQKINSIFEIMGSIKPCYIKAVLEMRGFRKTYARKPLLQDCDPQTYAVFEQKLRELFYEDGYFPG